MKTKMTFENYENGLHNLDEDQTTSQELGEWSLSGISPIYY
ncbi:hypothetical protein [Ammoniphilus resinae]|nr:hypothetical protein [Ammoniphilus resinae]